MSDRLAGLPVMAGAQPADVVRESALGIEGWLVAGVLADPGQIKERIRLRSVRASPLDQVDRRLRDALPNRRDHLLVGRER
jgi:hypothetical protein